MLEVALRLQAAAGHERVGDADGSRLPELHSDVDSIIPFQETSVNDTGQLFFVVLPVVSCQYGGDLLQLVGKTALAGDAKAFFQSGGYGLLMLRAVLPQPGAAGVLPFAGVRHVKDIAHPVFSGTGVNEGNAFGPPHHIPAHLLVPEVVVGAGGGVRTLGINQQLLAKRVFI